MNVVAMFIVPGSEGYSTCWILATIWEASHCKLTANEDVYVRTFGTTWGMLSPRPLSCESSCLVVVTVGIFCNSLLLFGSCLTVNWFKLIVQWLISDFYRVLHNYCQRKNRIGVDGPLLNPVHWSNFMGNWNWLLNKWNVCCFGMQSLHENIPPPTLTPMLHFFFCPVIYHFGHCQRDASAFVLDFESYIWHHSNFSTICEPVRAPAVFCLNGIIQQETYKLTC